MNPNEYIIRVMEEGRHDEIAKWVGWVHGINGQRYNNHEGGMRKGIFLETLMH